MRYDPPKQYKLASLTDQRVGRIGIKIIGALTGLTVFDKLTTLEDRSSSVFGAIWAQVVHRIGAKFLLSTTIYNRTGSGFPKLIAIQIGLRFLKVCKLVFERCKLQFEFCICNLCVGYLRRKFAQRAFNLRISTRIRSLEEVLDGIQPIGGLTCRRTHIPSGFEYVLNRLKIEFHHFLHNWNEPKAIEAKLLR